MDISNGQKVLATRADLRRLGITVSNSTLLRWEARGRFPRRARLAGTSVTWFLPRD
ncbi:MAG: AlpA family phage regulatory protein [Shimia thalassica]|uniref:AlpA family phage regulatory protein n=1 Tax=Shimia thalassica TaxID=1715693 RepID=UPI003299E264